MGKIRVKTVGDEDQEKQQAGEARQRADAKKAEAAKKQEAESADTTSSDDKDKEVVPQSAEQEVASVEVAPKTTKKKKEKFQTSKDKAAARSVSYKAKAALIDTTKQYSLTEAIKLLPQLKRANFDETVEIHITASETGVSGSAVLPHGTGKTTRVVIAQGSDQKALEDLIKAIEAGKIDFDVLVATPDAMPKLARVARVLGPKGLMPNPKNGTVTAKPEEVAKRYEGGQINFKTEAKFPLLHIAIGKVSFGEDKIKENAKTVLGAIAVNKIVNATLKSTMSPGISLDLNSL